MALGDELPCSSGAARPYRYSVREADFRLAPPKRESHGRAWSAASLSSVMCDRSTRGPVSRARVGSAGWRPAYRDAPPPNSHTSIANRPSSPAPADRYVASAASLSGSTPTHTS